MDQKQGVEIDADSQNSDLTTKQGFDRAHHLAYKISHSNPLLPITLLTRDFMIQRRNKQHLGPNKRKPTKRKWLKLVGYSIIGHMLKKTRK